jgi:L-fucose isomerase-like protein
VPAHEKVNEQIALVPLVSPLHEQRSVEEVISRYRRWLATCFDYELHSTSKLGIEEGRRIKPAAGILALVVTGGTERLIEKLVQFEQPTIIMVHKSMNTLPAALEALSSMEETRRPELVVGGTPAELEKVRGFGTTARTFARLRNHRLGLIGGPSPWLTYSLPDRKELSRRLGIRLVDIAMDEFRRAYEAASEPLVAKLAAEARSKHSSSKNMTLEDFARSSRIYAAIRKIADRHNLTAVSVKCFDFIPDYKATGCYAVAKLNDEDFVAGCEGDIPATTAMIVLAEVAKHPAFMANASFVRGHNLELAHCTIAPRLTDKYQYRTHFESGLGIAIAGVLKKGKRVTIVRFSNTLDRMRAGEGRVVRGEAWSEKLCRTQVKVKMDGDAELIKNRPLGNHYAVAYGEHVGTLRSLASFAGIGFEEI